MYTLPMFSTAPYSLKAPYSLETVSTVGLVNGMYIPRTVEGVEESLIAWVQLLGQLAAMSPRLLPPTK